MYTNPYFVTQKPSDAFLSTFVDYYFHIDVSVNQLSLTREFIIPFPRTTFGYFFNYPFLATNHTLNESVSINMAISRISTHKITIAPQTNRIKIIGAYVKPFCLAYLTRQSIKTLPWSIDTIALFEKTATDFQKKIHACKNADQMFEEVEKIFLDNILPRDLSLITQAVALIDENAGNISMAALAEKLGVSDRTIRTHFDNYMGCTPKEYRRLVKIKQVAYQLKSSENSLTSIAYDNHYFDQAHFIHDIKDISGRSPKELRKEMPNFRFLQF